MSEKGWVCPECGLDYDTISPDDAKVAIRSYPRRYREVLGQIDDPAREEMLRRRPSADVWSALEYTAHVADALDDMAGVFTRMINEDTPSLSGWDPDERAAQQRYNDQDPAQVLNDLDAAAEKAASALDRATPRDWHRTGHFDWGDRDLITMIRNAVHEGYHHLRDIERGLKEVRARPD
jgi:hypothetical protein